MLAQPKLKNAFKVAFYIRVSTEEQAQNPEGSIKNQDYRLRHALEYKQSLGRFGELKGVYTDAGISAKDMRRPQLQELLRAIKNQEIDLVMVTEISRLSRNTRDFIQIWDLMREHGCRFQSLREDFDTTNAAGELVLFQLMNLAQFERRQISERVGANFQARAERGLHNGGAIPVGLTKHPTNRGHLAIDEPMAKIVRKAFETFVKEGTLRRTAIALNQKGYQLRKQMENGCGLKRLGIFTLDNLHAILRNKAYIGIRVYKVNGELRESKAAWPAVVDAKLFDRVGKLLSKNNQLRLKPLPARKLPYILSGITSCQLCGASMSAKSATGNVGKVGYYEHTWKTKQNTGLPKPVVKCEPHRIPAKIIEPLVWDEFTKFVNDPAFVKQIFKRAQAIQKSNPVAHERGRLTSRLESVDSQAEALAERLSELPKGVPATPIYKQMEKLEQLRQELSISLETSTQSRSANSVSEWNTFDTFAKVYRKIVSGRLDPDQKRSVIQKFIRKIEVGTDSVKIHFIVDENHFRDELSFRKPNASPSGEKAVSGDALMIGSSRLTNGRGCGT
ncbi:MAG: hypothetical protein EOP05_01385 [Proteobacteria bacterium]|nr:MAG: hypothetical protein EOP05_01385 [Pseudomonadota bacterium]